MDVPAANIERLTFLLGLINGTQHLVLIDNCMPP